MSVEEKIEDLERRIEDLEYWKGLHQNFHRKFVPDKFKEMAEDAECE